MANLKGQNYIFSYYYKLNRNDPLYNRINKP